MNIIKKLFLYIKEKLETRKKLKELQKKDPFLYK
jgi:hypothetical protein